MNLKSRKVKASKSANQYQKLTFFLEPGKWCSSVFSSRLLKVGRERTVRNFRWFLFQNLQILCNNWSQGLWLSLQHWWIWQQPISEDYYLKCRLAASSLTTIQGILESMHGFSSWMKEAHISQTSTEYSLQKASFLLLTLETRNKSKPCCPKKNTYQCSWILRHLHGLLLLPEVALIIIKVFRWVLFSPGVHRPELLWHEVVHKESHALNHAQQHATHHSWTHLWYGACQDNFSIRNFTMLLGPCLAAITAPAAAPDMMEFQGSWWREEV